MDYQKPSERRARATAKSHRSGRKSNVDPATVDRIYDADESEFLAAMDKYRRESGRPFPTLCEVLGVLKTLGWAKG